MRGSEEKYAFRAGDQVTVFRIQQFARPLIEGRATIIEPIRGLDDYYKVQFKGERRIRQRLIHPGEWQADPTRMLRRLHTEWCLTITPDLLAEFFPTDI